MLEYLLVLRGAMAAQTAVNRKVAGSNPAAGAKGYLSIYHHGGDWIRHGVLFIE